MPKRNPNDDDAVFCVSISHYYSTEAEAKAEFSRLQSVVSNRNLSTEYYEWSEDDQKWFEIDNLADPKRDIQ